MVAVYRQLDGIVLIVDPSNVLGDACNVACNAICGVECERGLDISSVDRKVKTQREVSNRDVWVYGDVDVVHEETKPEVLILHESLVLVVLERKSILDCDLCAKLDVRSLLLCRGLRNRGFDWL